MTSDIEEYTHQLIDRLGLDADAYSYENELHRLNFEPDIAVFYGNLDPGVYLMGELLALPENNKEALFMSLMHLNLFGMGSHGGVIGLDLTTKILTLRRAIAYRITYDEFKDAIEDFVNDIEFWRSQLSQFADDKPSILLA